LSRADEGFAVRVLSTDIRRHGRQFVLIEFILAATICVALSLTVAVAAAIRGTGATNSAIGMIFFAGVAVNSLAVTAWVRSHADNACDRPASLRDLGAFAAATLLPGALVLALRS
jgi:hypothetical protein